MKTNGQEPVRVAIHATPLLWLALASTPIFAADQQAPVGVQACPLLPSAPSLPPYSDDAHNQQLQRWRAGQTDTAQLLATLAAWRLALAPGADGVRLQADLIEIATQAQAYDCALDRLSEADVARLPEYALPLLIRSARATRRVDLQGAAVRAWRQRSPGAWAPAMREAQWLIDLGRTADARAALDALAVRTDAGDRAHQIERLELEGALAEASAEPLLARLHYQELLGLAPEHAYARQFNPAILASLRGPELAVSEARQWQAADAAHVPTRQWAELQADLLASRYHDAIARRDQDAGLERFAPLDRVIDDYDALLGRVEQRAQLSPGEDAASWQPLLQSLRGDVLLALFERGRHAEVARRYERWQAAGYILPAYGLAAVAGSYAWLRRSDLAVPLYEQALRDYAPRLPGDVSLSLVYAYLDTGRFDDAQALLDRRGQDIPPYLSQAPRRQSPSRDFDDHQTLRASVALATDRIETGERLFEQFAASAPLNVDMQLGRVRAQQLRDHPRAARALLDGVRADHPASPTVQLSQFDLLLDQSEFVAAREQLEALESQYPEDGRVRRARERYALRTAGRLEMRLGAEPGGGALSNRETVLDARIYSPVIGDGVRLMGRQVRQHATLGSSHPGNFRTGLGLQVERGSYWLQAEVHRESLRARTGIEVEAAWRISDRWRLRAHVDTFSLDTPWRAKANGVRMVRADLGVRWIANESRWIDLNAQAGRFTDHNRRDELSASWYERWISQPAWQFSTTADLSAGRHTRQNVDYFSPRNYVSAQAWSRTQWLTWRRDQNRLLQVLELGGGVYRQNGHGTKPLYGVRLSHEWTLGRNLSFFYGLSWTRRPYDGVHEVQRSVFMGFVLPLS